MRLIRAATLTVSDIERSISLYTEYLDYKVVERGKISDDLAKSWGTPKTQSQPYAVLEPSSGQAIYVRFIEQPAHPDYIPLTSYGWGAIEICNQDTLAVNARMENSPFEIVGPPKELDGLPAIFPMQVKGPDGEIVYLTEIRDNLPMYDLPRAQSLIDCLFILVMACRDIGQTGAFLEKNLAVTAGREMEIIITMLNGAFDLPMDTKHKLATLKHKRDVFLEIDALPETATDRPTHDGFLPPCVAIGSFITPDFDHLLEVNEYLWISPPVKRDGEIYKNKRAGTIKTPDGTLIEIIEA